MLDAGSVAADVVIAPFRPELLASGGKFTDEVLEVLVVRIAAGFGPKDRDDRVGSGIPVGIKELGLPAVQESGPGQIDRPFRTKGRAARNRVNGELTTSVRRSPGTRRFAPGARSIWSGRTFTRRVVRNSRTSSRFRSVIKQQYERFRHRGVPCRYTSPEGTPPARMMRFDSGSGPDSGAGSIPDLSHLIQRNTVSQRETTYPSPAPVAVTTDGTRARVTPPLAADLVGRRQRYIISVRYSVDRRYR
jgi:hypothetical protein